MSKQIFSDHNLTNTYLAKRRKDAGVDFSQNISLRQPLHVLYRNNGFSSIGQMDGSDGLVDILVGQASNNPVAATKRVWKRTPKPIVSKV